MSTSELDSMKLTFVFITINSSIKVTALHEVINNLLIFNISFRCIGIRNEINIFSLAKILKLGFKSHTANSIYNKNRIRPKLNIWEPHWLLD